LLRVAISAARSSGEDAEESAGLCSTKVFAKRIHIGSASFERRLTLLEVGPLHLHHSDPGLHRRASISQVCVLVAKHNRDIGAAAT